MAIDSRFLIVHIDQRLGNLEGRRPLTDCQHADKRVLKRLQSSRDKHSQIYISTQKSHAITCIHGTLGRNILVFFFFEGGKWKILKKKICSSLQQKKKKKLLDRLYIMHRFSTWKIFLYALFILVGGGGGGNLALTGKLLTFSLPHPPPLKSQMVRSLHTFHSAWPGRSIYTGMLYAHTATSRTHSHHKHKHCKCADTCGCA